MRAIEIARCIADLWLAPRVIDASANMRVSSLRITSAARVEHREMMARCIELSRTAVSKGELPFASVICKDGNVVAEATNQLSRDHDVTRHRLANRSSAGSDVALSIVSRTGGAAPTFLAPISTTDWRHQPLLFEG